MLFEAVEFATLAHKGQFRKGSKVPYILHPLGVAKILIDKNCAQPLIIAGILHDTVEDTPVTLAGIEAEFGEVVARLVAGVTEPEKSYSWEYRKNHMLTELERAPIDVLAVSCADKIDNLHSLSQDYEKHGEAVWEKFSRPRESQKWYHESLMRIFEKRLSDTPYTPLFNEVQQLVQQVFTADMDAAVFKP
ncbi:metal dependent phosphohydrolase [Chloroherpeton thalassium ATCC 35110]|uniref:Metal dependent phosphohydrolase n=2 Tax=Chloroherpeton thalassium TaxID=100716 RepID=B3QU46_CHLT3|nr:metal dependent phosphohydrolase [Chloroherpeton thalassium ATCC 35110]